MNFANEFVEITNDNGDTYLKNIKSSKIDVKSANGHISSDGYIQADSIFLQTGSDGVRCMLYHPSTNFTYESREINIFINFRT